MVRHQSVIREIPAREVVDAEHSVVQRHTGDPVISAVSIVEMVTLPIQPPPCVSCRLDVNPS